LGIFFAFLNALSVFLVIFSLIFLLLFRRWGKREFARIEKKKKELEEILNTADQMIDELNRFSDYVITNLEEKSLTVEKMVFSLENKINHNKEYLENIKPLEIETKEQNIENVKTIIPFQSRASAAVNTKWHVNKNIPNENRNIKLKANSSKTAQILQLAEEGLNETEIAKKLNVGRGEIQLVLGMSKGIREA